MSSLSGTRRRNPGRRPRARSRLRGSSLTGPLLTLVAGGVLATDPATAQRPLHGVVADQATLSLIDSARVTVVGTELEAVTGGDGTFSFDGVPIGSLAVRIEAPGYPALVEQVEVARDVVLYMQVMMPRADALLGRLATPPADAGQARTAAELVAREILDMNPNTGNLGLNTNPVRLRGTRTFGSGGEPAVFLDGVRIGTFGPAMEVLSQIPAGDVRNIRVRRGPASTLLDGSADGSIHIETRSGSG